MKPILLPACILVCTAALFLQSARADGQWQLLETLPPAPGQNQQPGLAGAYAGVHNDCLIVAGGANFPDALPWDGGKKAYHDTVYALEKTGDTYTWHPQDVRLPAGLAYGTTITTEHGLLCMGGETPGPNGKPTPSDEVFVMQWNPSTKKVRVGRKLIGDQDDPEEIVPFPRLSVPTANLASVMHNDQVFILGGNTPNGYADKMWYLRLGRRVRAKGTNPAAPIKLIWRSVRMFKNPQRSHCLAVVQSDGIHDCIWVISGRLRDETHTWRMLTDMHRYNLQTRTWLKMGDIRIIGEEARCVMAGSVAADGFDGLLVFGGADGKKFLQLEEDIPQRIAVATAAGDQQHATDIAKSKIDLLNHHPGFSKDILRFSALSDSWEKSGEFPAPLPVTTTLLKWGDDHVIVSGEIRPGVRTPNIWKGRMVE